MFLVIINSFSKF